MNWLRLTVLCTVDISVQIILNRIITMKILVVLFTVAFAAVVFNTNGLNKHPIKYITQFNSICIFFLFFRSAVSASKFFYFVLLFFQLFIIIFVKFAVRDRNRPGLLNKSGNTMPVGGAIKNNEETAICDPLQTCFLRSNINILHMFYH